jgi:hypothetical protein
MIRVYKALCWVSVVFFGFTAFLAAQHWSIVALPAHWLLLSIGAMLVLSVALRWLGSRGAHRQVWFWAALAFGAALLRAGWVLLVPTAPVSDFHFYHSYAAALSQGRGYDLPPSSLLYSRGYPLFLTWLYMLAGPSVSAAKWLNVLLGAISAAFVFTLSRLVFGSKAATVAGLLFAIWPSSVMYSSVLGSEHLHIVFLVAGLACLSSIMRAKKRSPLGATIASGLLLGMGQSVRAVSGSVGVLGSLFLLGAGRAAGRRRPLLAAALLAATLSTALALGRLSGWPPAAAIASLANQILQGTNIDSKGCWNEQDGSIWWSASDLHSGMRIALARAAERVATHRLSLVALAVEKARYIWADDLFGAYWSTTFLTDDAPAFPDDLRNVLYAVSQYYCIWVTLAAALGAWRLSRARLNAGAALLLGVLWALVLIHAVLEVQSRYSYPWKAVAVLPLAAYAVVSEEKRSLCGA